MSDRRVEQFTRNGGHASFDPFGVIDLTRGHTRQTASAWVDVRPAGLYSGVQSHQPGFGITEARQPTYLRQPRQSGQATSVPLFTGLGMDSVHALSWTRPTGPWVRAPQDTATTRQPPDAYAERWRPGFIPEAWGTWPPVIPVGVSRSNYVASSPELLSQTPAGPVGIKASRPLLKLQLYDGSRSLDMFLMKFQYMADYLRWDEGNFHHLCASLEGATGQVLWDVGPCATTTNIIRPLQTRFGMQLQAECFKTELCARRRAQGESLQSLYQNICRLVTLAYLSADVALTNHVGKEAFTTALSDGNLQQQVMKREPLNIEAALSHAIEAYH